MTKVHRDRITVGERPKVDPFFRSGQRAYGR